MTDTETETRIITAQILFYDTYECEFGDGFYPVINQDDLSYKRIEIKFLFNPTNNCWIQMNQQDISGLDGDNGIKLLNIMNKKNNVNCIEIYNSHNKKIYPTY